MGRGNAGRVGFLMATVTLASGAEVDSGSIEWREECSARWRHVQNMRRLDRQGRRDYIANIERREGPEVAERLKAAFLADWEARCMVGSQDAEKTRHA